MDTLAIVVAALVLAAFVCWEDRRRQRAKDRRKMREHCASMEIPKDYTGWLG